MNAFGNLSGRIFGRQNYEKIPEPKTPTTQSKLLQRASSTDFSTEFTDRVVLQRLAIRVVEFPANARAELIATIGTRSEQLPLKTTPQVSYRTDDDGQAS